MFNHQLPHMCVVPYPQYPLSPKSQCHGVEVYNTRDAVLRPSFIDTAPLPPPASPSTLLMSSPAPCLAYPLPRTKSRRAGWEAGSMRAGGYSFLFVCFVVVVSFPVPVILQGCFTCRSHLHHGPGSPSAAGPRSSGASQRTWRRSGRGRRTRPC